MRDHRLLRALDRYSKKKIKRPIDSKNAYKTTVGEYYQYEVEELAYQIRKLIRMVEGKNIPKRRKQ